MQVFGVLAIVKFYPNKRAGVVIVANIAVCLVFGVICVAYWRVNEIAIVAHGAFHLSWHRRGS